VLVAAVALPFALSLGARTSAPAPLPAAGIGRLETGGRPVDLSDRIAPLPLLVDDLPDAASRAAAEAFRSAGVLRPDDVRAALGAAWQAVPAPAELRAPLDQLAADLLDPPEPGSLPIGTASILASLGDDRDNGGRLVNAAVMLFAYGALVDSGIAEVPELSDPSYGWVVEEQAVLLLDAVAARFGPKREQLLDQALFVSVIGIDEDFDRAVTLAARAVDDDPDDVTARWVLSNLQARRPNDARGYEEALATVRPLVDDPQTRLIGEVATADAYLAAAAVRSADAPRTAGVLARRAVGHYDVVLDEVADAGVFAGRARALALLGEDAAAVRAMEEAVARAPDAIDLVLDLAALQQAAGDVEAMQATALRAVEVTGRGWDPMLAEARLVSSVEPSGLGFAHHGDLGLFGQSVGSTRDHVAIIRTPQGAGFEAGIDVVPTVVDPALDSWRRGGLAADVAARLAVDASVALGDPEGAAAAIDGWWGQELTTSPRLVDDVFARLQTGRWAASLVAGEGMAPEAIDDFREAEVLFAAEAALRRAGAFERLESLCREVLRDDPGVGGQLEDDAARCLADALVLQGRPDDAADSLGGVDGDDPSDLLVRLGAARLDVTAADGRGRRALQQAAVDGGAEGATALVRLGIDDLDSGSVDVARSHLELALALLDPGEVDTNDRAAVADMRRARAVTQTDHGVALMRLAQVDPTRAPVCHPGRPGDLCAEAADDFAAALDIDPLNPVVLMDRAWADRAMGRPAAARESLATAVDVDPELFPAANDLGVLDARRGDDAAAGRAFRATLAADPEYALGWWNLGVHELRAGPTHFEAGHAALARAVRLDPSLSGAVLEYRTDEAVYRSTFGDLTEASSGWAVGRGYGLAATVLGGVGLVTALGRFADAAIAGVWENLVSLVGKLPGTSTARRRRIAGRTAELRRRLPAAVRPWLPWLTTGLALAVISIWTVWSREPRTLVAGVIGVAVATIAALSAHLGGHLLAARRWGGRLRAAQWSGGVVLALILLPFQASSGPYLAEKVDGAGGEDHLARVHAAGPVANLVLAAAAYLAYLVHPVALLLLTAQVSVAVAAYTLLPNAPLDGQPLSRHPMFAASLGIVVTAAGVAFATGVA